MLPNILNILGKILTSKVFVELIKKFKKNLNGGFLLTIALIILCAVMYILFINPDFLNSLSLLSNEYAKWLLGGCFAMFITLILLIAFSFTIKETDSQEVTFNNFIILIVCVIFVFITFLYLLMYGGNQDVSVLVRRVAKLEINDSIQDKRISKLEKRLTDLEKQFQKCVDCFEFIPRPPVIVIDKDTLEAQISVLQQEYTWKFGSSNDINRGENIYPIEKLNTAVQNFKHNLEDAISIICIGAASEEGNKKSEEKRARWRAERLQSIVTKHINHIVVHGLNVGQYTQGQKDSENQRIIVIIKIIKLTDKNRLEELLKKALIKEAEDRFPIDIRNYTKYQNNETMFIEEIPVNQSKSQTEIRNKTLGQ